MPLADPSGPGWLRSSALGRRAAFGWSSIIGNLSESLRRLFRGSRRPPRAQSDDEGTASSGARSPLLPRTPVFSGANAKRREDEFARLSTEANAKPRP